MTQQLDRNLMQDALALSQAACYASMSAKEHDSYSDQAQEMLKLTQKLVTMSIAALDAAVLPEIQPKEGEPTLQDYVDQAKAAVAAGQPVPDIVQDIPLPSPDLPYITEYSTPPNSANEVDPAEYPIAGGTVPADPALLP